MAVLFQGKSMQKCPSGYTICSELAGSTGRPNNTCMTKEECQRALEEKEKKVKDGETGVAKVGKDEDEEQEEYIQQKHEENVENLNDFITMLQKGVIVDIETGAHIGLLDPNNLEETVNFFKSMGRLFSNETIKDSKLGGDLVQFLNILNSEKLEGRGEVAVGLTEKFLQNKMGLN